MNRALVVGVIALLAIVDVGAQRIIRLRRAGAPPKPPDLATVAAGIYRLKSGAANNICAENSNKGEETIHRSTCSGNPFQRWNITEGPNKSSYFIEWEKDGNKVWTVEGLNASGTALTSASKSESGSAFQRWSFINVPGSNPPEYMIRSEGAESCVDFNKAAESKGKGGEQLRLTPSCDSDVVELRWMLEPTK